MRIALGLALALPLVACGSDGATSAGDDEPGADAGGSNTPGDLTPPARGFQLKSPEVTIAPGQEITYCWYFHTPNTEAMAIKKWTSRMTPGSHHMIMYTTTADAMPPGTLSDAECGAFGIQNVPSWTYAAQSVEAEVELPQDDGAGKPLGQDIAAGTSGYIQMHYLNNGDDPIIAHVTLNAEAYDAGVTYTKTAPFITYNASISIPPGAMGDIESAHCTPSPSAKFWSMSTHSHKQAVKTLIDDAATEIFSSTDWEHPGAKTWMDTPFYSFTGALTYECTYDNTGSNAGSTVKSGPSANTNEMCMATGYYFPATKALMCLNNSGPF